MWVAHRLDLGRDSTLGSCFFGWAWGARGRGEKFWPTRASTAWVKEKPWTLIR